MSFSSKLDQFIKTNAEEFSSQYSGNEFHDPMGVSHERGAASLKPIVLKLVEALETYKYISNGSGVTQYSCAAQALAEVLLMIGEGK